MAEHFRRSAELLKHSVEHSEHSAKLSRVLEKTKSSSECLKRLAACLCYNMAHAVPKSIDHGRLGQRGPCCNTNTRLRFLKTQPSFSFSIEAYCNYPSDFAKKVVFRESD